ncbi:MAG TPA: DUF5666 domain-containing protein [Acidimicrobiales bacterium]|nr:DUF5666 domain-containing protein [Acidimicrobiales bacterium]
MAERLISKKWAIRTGVGLVAVCGLAAGGYGVAHAAGAGRASVALTASPSSSGSSGEGSSSSSTRHGWFGRGGAGFGRGAAGFGPGGAGFGPGGAGFGPSAFGRIGAAGTVGTVGSASFTLTTRQGGTLTVDTTKSTTYFEALSKVSASALKPGEQVAVVFTPPAAAPASSGATTTGSVTPTAATVDIILPSLQGTVLSISGGTIVIEDSQGFHRTIDTTTSTTYSEAGTTVSATAVTDGLDIVAFGSIAADHTDLDATTVEVTGPVAGGKVTNVSGTTITVSAPWGTGSTKITTTSSTIFRNGDKSSSIVAVKLGDLLTAIGTRASDGTFAATAVRFGSLPSAGAGGAWSTQGGGFFKGPGPMGFGDPFGVGRAPVAPGGGVDGATGFGSYLAPSIAS